MVDGEQGTTPRAVPIRSSAISLPHPVLDRERWAPVLDVVAASAADAGRAALAGAGQPDYKPSYYGDLRSRDAAYHQGTVWAWLIGPFVDAWLKVYPDDRAEARQFLAAASTRIWRGLHRLDQRGLRRRSRLTRRAAASPRPGASPKCCVRLQKTASSKLNESPASA